MKILIESHNTLIKRLTEIKEYIHQTMAQHALIESVEATEGISENAQQYLEYLKSLKSSTIQYNAIIISIYGCYENYVDSLISRYCKMLFQKSRCFENLPEKLKDKLREKIGEYLLSPHRFPEDIDFKQTVQNYSLMIESNFSNLVDLRFATTHAGNLRVGEIIKLFNETVCTETNGHILHSQSIKSFYLNNQSMDAGEYERKKARAAENLGKSELMKPLEELVEQRNTVAHSWNEGNRLSVEHITNVIIPFLEAFSVALLEICIISYFQLFGDDKTDIPNGRPIKVYNHNIICLNNQALDIAVGDYIVYGKEKHNSCARIIGMQINSTEITEVDSMQNVDVGLKIDGYFSTSDIVKYIIKI